MTAQLVVLTTGYADDRVASTCTLLRDGAKVVVVDPGMVADTAALLTPLAELGLRPEDVTDVVVSHHHLDHTMNVALFPRAAVHDFMATYHRDEWIDHDPGEFVITESIRLLPTPGHTDQDVTTAVETDGGLVVLTHLWWSAEGPLEDPFAPDADQLRRSRERVVALTPSLIVPGHGAPFTVTDELPI